MSGTETLRGSPRRGGAWLLAGFFVVCGLLVWVGAEARETRRLVQEEKASAEQVSIELLRLREEFQQTRQRQQQQLSEAAASVSRRLDGLEQLLAQKPKPKEGPFYKGVPLDEWLMALQDADGATRREAALAVSALAEKGRPQALAALRERVADSDPAVRKVAVESFAKGGGLTAEALQALGRRLSDPDEEVRKAASHIVIQVAPRHVPALLKEMRSDFGNASQPAICALGALGPEAIPRLVESLEDGEVRARSAATRALAMIGPDAKEAVAALREAANKDADEGVRWGAAAAVLWITRCQPTAEARLDRLELLSAILTSGFGPGSDAQAQSLLERHLAGKDEGFAVLAAVEALGYVGAGAPKASDGLKARAAKALEEAKAGH
jgi:HEAT repeat protein